MSTYYLPDAGEGLTEATIVTWRVKAGDTIAVNEIIVEIETAKSIVELPSPFSGVVGELLVQEGETVPVGTPLVEIADGVGADVDVAEPVEEDEKREPILVGYGPKSSTAKRQRARKQAASAVVTTTVTTNGVLAKPPVRKLAKDLGVDLATLAHVGEVITRADVEKAAQESQRIAQPSPRVPLAGERIEVSGVRKTTADSVSNSAFTAPHATIWVETDITETVELLATLRKRHPGEPISMLTIVGRAVITALKNHPMLNSSWRGDHIVLHPQVDFGFAAATERGLLVVHVNQAEQLSFVEFAREIARLKDKARAGKATPAELVGGTFTVTNIGVFDIDGGTPILVPGQSGIMSMGRTTKKPWVVNDLIVIRDVMTLALSFDHRVVDGEQGSKFLADVASILTEPGLALAM